MVLILLVFVVLLLVDSIHGQIASAARKQPDLNDSVAKLRSCCDIANSTLKRFDSCIRDIDSESATSKVLMITVSSEGKQFQTHKIQNIRNFTVYQEAILKSYALHNEYSFIPFGSYDIGDEIVEDQRWTKIKLLSDLLDNKLKLSKRRINLQQYDYILWVDADAIVFDFGMKIELIAQQFPKAHIIASSDIRMGFINSGIMLVRNSQWSARFFSDWWTIASNKNQTCDQDAFDMLYKRYATASQSNEVISDLIQVLPMHGLNSHPPAIKYQQLHHQFLHLMGESTLMRTTVFQRAFGDVCRTLEKQQQTLTTQLGLERRNLIQIAEKVYSSELKYQLEIAQDSNATHAELDRLSQSAHHLCDIYELLSYDQLQVNRRINNAESNEFMPENSSENMSENEKKYENSPSLSQVNLEIQINWNERIEQLRKQLYELVKNKLREIVANSNKPSDKPFDIMNFIMLLKRAAESGNDYFRVASSDSLKRVIASEVFDILDELQSHLAEESKNVPIHMKALMYQNLGRLDNDKANELLAQYKSGKTKHAISNSNYQQRKKIELKMKISDKLKNSQQNFLNSMKEFSIIQSIIEIDINAYREYIDSVQMLAASKCLYANVVDMDNISSSENSLKEALFYWDKVIEMSRSIANPRIQVGIQWETLAEILHNSAVCYFEAYSAGYTHQTKLSFGNLLERSSQWVEESIRIRRDIEDRAANIAQQQRLQGSPNQQLMSISEKLQNSIQQALQVQEQQQLRQQHSQAEQQSGGFIKQADLDINHQNLKIAKSKPGKVLLVVPVGGGDVGSQTDPIVLDEEEWEECDDLDSDCETFEVQQELDILDGSSNEEVSTEGLVRKGSDLSAYGEMSEDEIKAIQEQYQSRASRYTIKLAHDISQKDAFAAASVSTERQHHQQDHSIQQTRATAPETMSHITVTANSNNELQERIEKLEEIVLVLNERVRLLEKKNRESP